LLDGDPHLLAQIVGGVLALNARLRDGQDEDALLHGTMQKWAGSGRHAALEIKGYETSLWTAYRTRTSETSRMGHFMLAATSPDTCEPR
jgi:hypothetical protein